MSTQYDEIMADVDAHFAIPEDTSDYLAHWGILGQKWGVRRWQNEDGSLTEEGKKRYLKNDVQKANKAIENYDNIKAYDIMSKSQGYKRIKDNPDVKKSYEKLNDALRDAQAANSDYDHLKWEGEVAIISELANDPDADLQTVADNILGYQYDDSDDGRYAESYYYSKLSPDKQKKLTDIANNLTVADNDRYKALTNAVNQEFGDAGKEALKSIYAVSDIETEGRYTRYDRAYGIHPLSRDTMRAFTDVYGQTVASKRSEVFSGSKWKAGEKQAEKILTELNTIPPSKWYDALSRYADKKNVPVSELTESDWDKIRNMAGVAKHSDDSEDYLAHKDAAGTVNSKGNYIYDVAYKIAHWPSYRRRLAEQKKANTTHETRRSEYNDALSKARKIKLNNAAAKINAQRHDEAKKNAEIAREQVKAAQEEAARKQRHDAAKKNAEEAREQVKLTQEEAANQAKAEYEAKKEAEEAREQYLEDQSKSTLSAWGYEQESKRSQLKDGEFMPKYGEYTFADEQGRSKAEDDYGVYVEVDGEKRYDLGDGIGYLYSDGLYIASDKSGKSYRLEWDPQECVYKPIELEPENPDWALHSDENNSEEALAHYGIDGQTWGIRNGPPYPLHRQSHTVVQYGHQAVDDYMKSNGNRDTRGLNQSQNQNKQVKTKSTTERVASLLNTVATAADVASGINDAVNTQKYTEEDMKRLALAKGLYDYKVVDAKDANGDVIYVTDSKGNPIKDPVTGNYQTKKWKVPLARAKGQKESAKDVPAATFLGLDDNGDPVWDINTIYFNTEALSRDVRDQANYSDWLKSRGGSYKVETVKKYKSDSNGEKIHDVLQNVLTAATVGTTISELLKKLK